MKVDQINHIDILETLVSYINSRIVNTRNLIPSFDCENTKSKLIIIVTIQKICLHTFVHWMLISMTSHICLLVGLSVCHNFSISYLSTAHLLYQYHLTEPHWTTVFLIWSLWGIELVYQVVYIDWPICMDERIWLVVLAVFHSKHLCTDNWTTAYQNIQKTYPPCNKYKLFVLYKITV